MLPTRRPIAQLRPLLPHGRLARLALALAVTAPAMGQCENQKLFAAAPEDLDAFGWCTDIYGDIAAIGAPGEDDACPSDPANCNSGAVYIYEQSGGLWSPTARLLSSDLASKDNFGQDLSIWGDRLVVGAHTKVEGAAYVFVRSGGVWTEEAKLQGSDTQPAFHFGHSVSLVEDTILVGSMRNNHAGSDSGAAYLYERVGSTWTETAKLIGSAPESGARFGRAIASTSDWALVGAPFTDQPGADSGAVFVFERDDSGTPGDRLDDTWPETQLLVGSDTDDGDLFGRALAVQGDTLVVAASRAEVAGVPTGAAYVYQRQGGAWVQVQKLFASDGADNDQFGMSLELDGERMLIGARWNDEAGFNSGAVYHFERSSAGWVETAKITASDATPDAWMGDEMAVSLWGTTAFMGSRFSAVAGNLAGEAYVLDLGGCIGSTYCTVTVNSTGMTAPVEGRGTRLVEDNNFEVHASSLPTSQFGYFLVSPVQGFFPLAGTSMGNLCLHGPIGRYVGNVFNTGATGTGSMAVDLGAIPVPMGPPTVTQPGDTLNFQAWHRDVVAGMPTSNFTEAIEVLFF